MNKKFSFVGAGKMASAIVGGIIESGAVRPQEIECACGNDDTGRQLAEKTGVSLAASIKDFSADTIILACKPQQLADVAKSLEGRAPALLVSILAGTTIARLRAAFPKAGIIVRVMPNLPALISKGVSCYASNETLSEEIKKKVESLLSAIGEVIECDEKDLDAVTALSGSGPGYIFEFAAAMIEAGVKLGLSEDVAKKLCLSTFEGSALLMKSQKRSPEELRNAVSSPGGTTLAALQIFADKNLRKTVSEAMESACKRAKELSEM